MFLKRKDGVTQRSGTTKCHSCRTSGGPVKVSHLNLALIFLEISKFLLIYYTLDPSTTIT